MLRMFGPGVVSSRKEWSQRMSPSTTGKGLLVAVTIPADCLSAGVSEVSTPYPCGVRAVLRVGRYSCRELAAGCWSFASAFGDGSDVVCFR